MFLQAFILCGRQRNRGFGTVVRPMLFCSPCASPARDLSPQSPAGFVLPYVWKHDGETSAETFDTSPASSTAWRGTWRWGSLAEIHPSFWAVFSPCPYYDSFFLFVQVKSAIGSALHSMHMGAAKVHFCRENRQNLALNPTFAPEYGEFFRGSGASSRISLP